jgi:FAD/FMN-containing dehydrogenase
VLLSGLEHLDERYIKAVKYSTKAARRESPKMVLIADIASDDAAAANEAAKEVVRIARSREGEGFIASSPEARRRFWQDRARTAAISAHTNAFKINEDVVIPLDRLAEYNEGIERINIEYSTRNKLTMVDAVRSYLGGTLPELKHNEDYEDSEESRVILADKQRAVGAELLAFLQFVGARRPHPAVVPVHLDRRQPIQGFSYRPIGDFQCSFYTFPFYHLGDHRTSGNGSSAAEGLEFGINDGVIIYLNIKFHYITAHRVPHMSDAIGIFYLPYISGILEVLHHLVAVQ